MKIIQMSKKNLFTKETKVKNVEQETPKVEAVVEEQPVENPAPNVRPGSFAELLTR